MPGFRDAECSLSLSLNLNWLQIAMEPEGPTPLSALSYDTLGWGEGWTYQVPPQLDAMKFLSLGKHQVNICDRWQQNKAKMAGTAWFNGTISTS
jgi:hypothetical protein